MIEVLIIEDEIQNAEVLKQHLSACGEAYHIIAVLRSNKEIKEWFLNGKNPDLIFCDIELLDGNVFKTLKEGFVNKPIVFTTAYDNFYQEAFDNMGIAYLLKPISLEKVKSVLQKVTTLGLSSKQEFKLDDILNALEKARKKYKERILVNSKDGIKLIETRDIVHVQTTEGICTIHHSSGVKYEMRYKLSDLINELDPDLFFMINRGEIINMKFIDNIEPYYSDRLALSLKGLTQKVITSKSQTHLFRKWLS